MMLTHEQEEMFKENENLVYTTIKNYVKTPGKYGLNNYDDIVSIGKFALCKAILSYDPQKAAFSSYAVKTIRNHIYNVLRDANDILDTTLSTSEEFIELNTDLVYNNIVSMSDELTLKEGISIIEKCAESYSGIAQKGAISLKLMILGYSCNDIAKMYDVDQKMITAWISRARQKLKKEPELLRLLNKI